MNASEAKRTSGSRRALITTMLVVAISTACVADAQAETAAIPSVSIRLSWKLKGEFAPLYVALDRGYFAAEKLNVTIGEGTSSQAAMSSALENHDQAAWVAGSFALEAISNGMPVKVVGLYNRVAPAILLSRAVKPVRTPQELVGKIVGASVGAGATSFLPVLCKKNHVDCNSFKTVTIAPSARVPSLMAGKVAVVAAYRSNDLPILQSKFGAKTFAELDLAKYGVRVMGASLVVSDDYLAKNPKIVARLIRAINHGFEDTLKDPEAAAKIILKHWHTALKLAVVTSQIKEFDAAVKPEPGRPISWVAPEAIDDTLEALMGAGLLKSRKPTAVYLDNSLQPKKSM